MDGARDRGDIIDPLAPLGDGADDLYLVVNLMQGTPVTPDIKTLDLPGEEQDRRGSGIGRAQRGAGVLDAWPRHDERDAWLPSHARVAIGHICRGLLMPYGYETDIRLRIKGIVDAHDLHAG